MKKRVNKRKLKKVLLSVVCVILVITIALGSVAFIANYPDNRTPVFSDSEKKADKKAFDEGEFKLGEYDLVVSVNGNDEADGTLEKPLKTLKAAKEKLKSLSLSEDIPMKKLSLQAQGKLKVIGRKQQSMA